VAEVPAEQIEVDRELLELASDLATRAPAGRRHLIDRDAGGVGVVGRRQRLPQPHHRRRLDLGQRDRRDQDAVGEQRSLDRVDRGQRERRVGVGLKPGQGLDRGHGRPAERARPRGQADRRAHRRARHAHLDGERALPAAPKPRHAGHDALELGLGQDPGRRAGPGPERGRHRAGEHQVQRHHVARHRTRRRVARVEQQPLLADHVEPQPPVEAQGRAQVGAGERGLAGGEQHGATKTVDVVARRPSPPRVLA
jgi:hypothetical protein